MTGSAGPIMVRAPPLWFAGSEAQNMSFYDRFFDVKPSNVSWL